MADLSVKFCGKTFINPFVIAASPSSDSLDKVERAFKAGWAGAVLKTIEPEGKQRSLAEPNMGGLDFLGRKQMAFYNYDLCTQQSMESLCAEIRTLKKDFPDRIVMASIMAATDQEWADMIHDVEDAGADIIECSVSCPQGDKSGRIPAADPELIETYTKSMKAHVRKGTPVVIKLTPNVTDIAAVAEGAERGGADGLVAIDTVKSFIGIDIETGLPKLNVGGKSTYGGLSGPAVKPIALGCVARIAQRVSIPIAGVGGISGYKDAVEFMMLGCGIVEMCTAVLRYGYKLIDRLCEGLSQYMDRHQIKDLSSIRGTSLKYIVTQMELSRDWHAVNVTDLSSCRKCRSCIVTCQDGGFGALTLGEDGYPKIDIHTCVGCGACKTVCPAGCIEIRKYEEA